MRRPGCLVDTLLLASAGECCQESPAWAGIGNENPSSSINVTMDETAPISLIHLYQPVGVVFYQKIAENTRRSSGSNNPVNSPITTQEAS